MPIVKCINGHTGCGGIRRYLEKNGRALSKDLFNLSWDDYTMDPAEVGLKSLCDWDAEMDWLRHECGNDTPYEGKRALTFRHYVISPDPGDNLSLSQVQELARAWVKSNFSEYQVAIIYHDDNTGQIPHAHIVVNNTNIVTEKRLHIADPYALNRELQDMAEARGFKFLRDEPRIEDESGTQRRSTPATMQQVYLRRSEVEIAKEGGYSWVTDIRGRVTIAKALARDEGEFMAILDALDIEVAENSPKAWRRDWIYTLRDCPTWRVGGEKLGLSFGQESLRNRFGRIAAWHPSAQASREVLSHARDAVTLNDIADLEKLSASMETCMAFNARSVEELDRRIARIEQRGDVGKVDDLKRLVDARDFVVENRLLPANAQQVQRVQAVRNEQQAKANRRRVDYQRAGQAARRREREGRNER
jgi:hypothetical protein